MTPRRQRLLLVLIGLVALGIGASLVASAFQKNLVFFFTPSQVLAGEVPKQQRFRVGGLVQAGSVQREAEGAGVSFRVTDQANTVDVHYQGALPDLFKEGKGVVAQGRLVDGLGFVADEVLAKHDENYMPPEAAYALKKAADDSKAAR